MQYSATCSCCSQYIGSTVSGQFRTDDNMTTDCKTSINSAFNLLVTVTLSRLHGGDCSSTNPLSSGNRTCIDTSSWWERRNTGRLAVQQCILVASVAAGHWFDSRCLTISVFLDTMRDYHIEDCGHKHNVWKSPSTLYVQLDENRQATYSTPTDLRNAQ